VYQNLTVKVGAFCEFYRKDVPVKLLKRLAVVVSLAVVVGATMASPAFATGTKWNVTGSANIKGSLTLKKNGGSAVTCTVTATGAVPTNEEGFAFLYSYNWENLSKCSNGSLWGWGLENKVEASGGKLTLGFDTCCVPHASPWSTGGGIWQGGGEVPFTNGSGTTNSHIDFNETEIGFNSWGESVTATGKLEIYRSGGLLTVSTF
jgi:hypothetical protein